MNPQQGLTLIEQARDRIVAKPHKYQFTDWRQCVCGNFYRAATGRIARNQLAVVNPRPSRYYELMLLVKPVIETMSDFEYGGVEEAIMALSSHCATIAIGPGDVVPATVARIEEVIGAYKRYYADELGPQLGDIGQTERVITIVPSENPVPEQVPEREQIPAREPDRTPERTPEKVPARD